jgi:hypothetical protein
MVKIFYKNLFQSFWCFVSILFLNIILLVVFFIALSHESDYSWVLLVIICMVFILFFLLGFYWIFQKVVIDNEGIKISLLNRTLKSLRWDEIISIKEVNHMRAPALEIEKYDGFKIYLDKRKNIINAIKQYYEMK